MADAPAIVETAIGVEGGPGKLAAALGVHGSAVSKWRRGDIPRCWVMVLKLKYDKQAQPADDVAQHPTMAEDIRAIRSLLESAMFGGAVPVRVIGE